MSRLVRPALILVAPLLVTTACDGPAEKTPAWTLPAPSGKADGGHSFLLDGSEIPSGYVEDDRRYLRARKLATLRSAGLEGPARAVLERADGIIDANDHDGVVDLAELVNLEGVPHFALMSESEREALPEIWSLYEVPTDSIDLPVPEIAAPAFEDRTLRPENRPLHPMPLSAFDSGLRETLRRVTSAFDDDDDPETVSLDDIDTALMYPGAFTQLELNDILLARHSLLVASDVDADARLAVEPPASACVSSALGTVSVGLSASLFYEKTQTLRVTEHLSDHVVQYRDYEATLLGIRETVVTAEVGDGATLTVTSLDDGETTLETALGALDLASGEQLLEVWVAGERTHAATLQLDEETLVDTELDLSRFAQHDIETLNGTPLRETEWWSATDEEQPSTWVRDREYTVVTRATETAESAPGPFDTTASTMLASTAHPGSREMVDGRYTTEVDGVGEIVLELYPRDAVRIEADGVEGWMHVSRASRTAGGPWELTYEFSTPSHARVELHEHSGRLLFFEEAEDQSPAARVDLDDFALDF